MWAVDTREGAEEVEGIEGSDGAVALAAKCENGHEVDGEEGGVVSEAEEASAAAFEEREVGAEFGSRWVAEAC